MNNNWFLDARFGMFIHYGAYSVGERGEWILNRERIDYEEYTKKYVNNFKAEHYEPEQWAKLAYETGMKYMVLTTKHHDGFCLWDTKTTDFNTTKMGPNKDLVKQYVQAVRKYGLKVGIYYSPADWHSSDYPNPYCRDWPINWDDEQKRKRFVAFYTEQIKELVSNYGKIDLFWYDGCIPKPLDGIEVNKMIKQHQPDILISNRNGKPYDFKCCEQAIVPERDGMPWEACMTLNGHWGYHAGDDNYKTPTDVIKLLLTVAKDRGNLLLNVGPMADGTIPLKSIEILQDVGGWIKANGEAIYGTENSPFSWGMSHIITVKDNRVFISLYNKLSELCVAEIKNKVTKVYILKSGEPLPFAQTENGRLFIGNIKDTIYKDFVITIVCEVEGRPQALVEQKTFWIPGE